jgi:glycerophosphoryl diester phosphodiesterase
MSVFGGRPTILGHRGLGSGVVDGHVENTPDSFRVAAKEGLRWIETDVRRTLDDVLVVGHNPSLDDGSFLERLTLAQARQVGVLTLDEVLEELPDGIGLNLDVKSCLEDALRPPDQTTAAMVAPVARQISRERPFLLSSFDASVILLVRERAPEVPLGLLTWFTFPLRKAIAAAAQLHVEVVSAQVGSFLRRSVEPKLPQVPNEYAVDVAHRAGLEVMCWCPAVDDAQDLFKAGVDAVVVNDVPRALEGLVGHAD